MKLAQKYIRAIQASDPKFMPGEVYELLGDIEVHPGINNYKQAQDYYKMSVAAKPNRIDIYIKLARTHERLREIEEAILNYNKCLRRDK